MSVFSFDLDNTLTRYSLPADEQAEKGVVKASRSAKGFLGFGSDKGEVPDPSNQFVIFQLASDAEGDTLRESSEVDPVINGSQEAPDVLVALEMLSFNLGKQDQKEVGKNTRATMRINFGKDESSTDKLFDNVFWSIAAGLKLYNSSKERNAEGKEMKSDFREAFGNRPIEIPGGLGVLSFEVVKHEDPKWWERIFSFLQSKTGESLISVLGFPAIAKQAIDVVDQLFERLSDQKFEPIFKSMPMRLALSKYARDQFTGGSKRVRIGALSQGFSVMARGQDFEKFNQQDLIYYPTYGRLIPGTVSPSDLLKNKYDDPLEDVTYAVFRVGAKEAKLDPSFDFHA